MKYGVWTGPKALYEKTKFNYQNCNCWRFLIYYSILFDLSVDYAKALSAVLFQKAALNQQQSIMVYDKV